MKQSSRRTEPTMSGDGVKIQRNSITAAPTQLERRRCLSAEDGAGGAAAEKREAQGEQQPEHRSLPTFGGFAVLGVCGRGSP